MMARKSKTEAPVCGDGMYNVPQNALKMDFPRFIITFFLPDRLAFKKEQDAELNWAKDEIDDLKRQVKQLKTEKEEWALQLREDTI